MKCGHPKIKRLYAELCQRCGEKVTIKERRYHKHYFKKDGLCSCGWKDFTK